MRVTDQGNGRYQLERDNGSVRPATPEEAALFAEVSTAVSALDTTVDTLAACDAELNKYGIGRIGKSFSVIRGGQLDLAIGSMTKGMVALADLNDHNQELKQRNAELQRDLVARMEILEDVRTERDQVKVQLQDSTRRIAQLEDELEAADAKYKQNGASVTKQAVELIELRRAVRDADDARAAAEMRMVESPTQIGQLQTEVIRLNQDLQLRANVIKERNASIAELERRILGHQERINEQDKEVAKTYERAAKAEKELSTTRIALRDEIESHVKPLTTALGHVRRQQMRGAEDE